MSSDAARLGLFGFLLLLAPLAGGCGGSASSADDVEAASADAQESQLSATTNDLSAAQQKNLLLMLDDACSDAWCETDYEFLFKRIRCSFAQKSCTVTLLTVDPKVGSAPARTFWRSCKVSPLESYATIVDTAANGYTSLSTRFFDDVDRCMTKVEASIPPR